MAVTSIQASRSLVDVLYEDIIPRLSVEDAYPSVSFVARRGRHWRGGCPLHGGDDPNFSVDTQTLSWTCFSHCGHGSFLAYLNGGETPRGQRFLELLNVLAYRVGVPVEPARGYSPAARAALQRSEILEAFVAVATESLAAPEASIALRYLASRGFPSDPDSLGRLGLAFYPPPDKIRLLRTPSSELAEAGLTDSRWRGRILIPWRDESGRVATIAARTIGAEVPRYLYLRDAPLPAFFGTRRRGSVQDRRRLVVVEGLIDALLMQMLGVEDVVAIGGTSISSRHVHAVTSAGVHTLILALDADAAGAAATDRFLVMLDRDARDLRVQVVPPGAFLGEKDPAALIERHGPVALEAFLDARLPRTLYEANRVLEEVTASSPIARRRDALDALVGIAARASGPERRADLEDVSGLAVSTLGYPAEVVREALGLPAAPSDRQRSVVTEDTTDRAGARTTSAPVLGLLRAVCEGPLPDDASPAPDAVVWAIVDELGERLSTLLSCRFGRSGRALTLTETAPLISRPGQTPISRGRVRQLEIKALGRLRTRSRRERLGIALPPAPPKAVRGDSANLDGRSVGSVADAAVRTLEAIGSPISVSMITHILRASTGPVTREFIRRYGLPTAPSLTGHAFVLDLDLVRHACDVDPRIERSGTTAALAGIQPVSGPEPRNRGAAWSEAEERQLRELWLTALSLEAIAERHGRSLGGIVARLVQLELVPDRETARQLAMADSAERLRLAEPDLEAR